MTKVIDSATAPPGEIAGDLTFAVNMGLTVEVFAAWVEDGVLTVRSTPRNPGDAWPRLVKAIEGHAL